MLPLTHIKSFHAVAQFGSFTEAARVLMLDVSTVSKHVAALERRLGERLLDRGRSAIAVTIAGRRVLDDAKKILEAHDRILGCTLSHAEVKRPDPGPSARVRQEITGLITENLQTGTGR